MKIKHFQQKTSSTLETQKVSNYAADYRPFEYQKGKSEGTNGSDCIYLFLVHGCRKFVELTDLEDHNFMDRDGEFQLEFMLSSIQSIFEHKFRIKMFHNSMKMGKLETGYFAFGLYDWSLSIYPTGRADSQLGNTLTSVSFLVV